MRTIDFDQCNVTARGFAIKPTENVCDKPICFKNNNMMKLRENTDIKDKVQKHLVLLTYLFYRT